MKALNFGSLNLDYVYQVEHFVQPGETLSASSQQVNPGGKGLNQSVALARAGAEVYHAGCVGAGGERLTVLLADNGVDTEHIRRVEEVQGNAVIQVTAKGENCILLFGGSNQCVTEKQIAETLSCFSEGDYLLLQNEINGLPQIVAQAAEIGMRIVLNPSPYDSKLDAVNFSRLSWLLINEVEAAQISGSDDPEEAWERIHARWPQVSAVITLGGEGSMAFRVTGQGVERFRQAAWPAKVVDTTAAGDTFTGYFIAGLMEGRSLADCMSRANRASGISVSRPGAAESIPRREEIESETK